MKNTQHNIASQAISKNFRSSLILTINSGGNTLNNLYDTVQDLSEGAQIILNKMLDYAQRLEFVRFAQETIASDCDYTREWSNKKLKELKLAGIIDFFGPQHEVCNYVINELFLLPNIRARFAPWFASLKVVIKKQFTPLRIKGIYKRTLIKIRKTFSGFDEQPFIKWDDFPFPTTSGAP